MIVDQIPRLSVEWMLLGTDYRKFTIGGGQLPNKSEFFLQFRFLKYFKKCVWLRGAAFWKIWVWMLETYTPEYLTQSDINTYYGLKVVLLKLV